MADTATIYALSDPRIPAKIRYIGKTGDVSNLSKRLNNHLNCVNRWKTPKNDWLKKLASEKVIPIIWPIEVVDVIKWEEREKFYISFFRKTGWILNVSDGGNTGPNMKGFKHSEQTRKKLSDKFKGRVVTDKMRESLISRNKNRVYTPEMKKSISDRMKSWAEKNPEQVKKSILTCQLHNTGKKRPNWVIQKIVDSKRRNGTLCLSEKCKPKTRKIICVETKKIYECIADATREFRISHGAIGNALKSGGCCQKLHWKYVEIK